MERTHNRTESSGRVSNVMSLSSEGKLLYTVETITLTNVQPPYVQTILRNGDGFTLMWTDSDGKYERFNPTSYVDSQGKTRYTTEVLYSNVK